MDIQISVKGRAAVNVPLKTLSPALRTRRVSVPGSTGFVVKGLQYIRHSFPGSGHAALYLATMADKTFDIHINCPDAASFILFELTEEGTMERCHGSELSLPLQIDIAQRWFILFLQQKIEIGESLKPDPAGLDIREAVHRIIYNPYSGVVKTILQNEMVKTIVSPVSSSAIAISTPKHTEAIVLVKSMVDEWDIAEPLDLRSICRTTGLNRFNLSKAFKEMTGVNVSDYFLERRLIAAREQLLTTNDAINTIAYACGYALPSSFSYQFKRRFGMRPGRLRKENKRFTFNHA